jgi:hypothetical protein
MQCLGIVGKNASNAVYVSEVQDQAMDIMSASQRLAGAVAKMMKVASAVADGIANIFVYVLNISCTHSGDESQRDALRTATFTANAAGLWMNSACEEVRTHNQESE